MSLHTLLSFPSSVCWWASVSGSQYWMGVPGNPDEMVDYFKSHKSAGTANSCCNKYSMNIGHRISSPSSCLEFSNRIGREHHGAQVDPPIDYVNLYSKASGGEQQEMAVRSSSYCCHPRYRSFYFCGCCCSQE